MPIISGGTVIEGSIGRAIQIPGAPVAGTNEVQTLTLGGTPTGGTFLLKFEGRSTVAITWTAVDATLIADVQAALDTLLGTNAVVATDGTLTSGIGTIVLTYSGAPLLRKNVSLMVAVSSLTGTAPTAVVGDTTPGVDATYRGAATGSMVVRVDTGVVYVNTSTSAGAPTWTVVGAQT